jgi:hypothetical protein
MPGAPAFAALREVVAAARQAQGHDGDAFLATVMLWTGLHGMVTLRADRPAFAWPALDVMIDSLVRQVLAAAG